MEKTSRGDPAERRERSGGTACQAVASPERLARRSAATDQSDAVKQTENRNSEVSYPQILRKSLLYLKLRWGSWVW
jgi:hypothetical protein